MTMQSSWYPLLRQVFIFATFTESQIGAVADKMKLISLPRGATLYNRGDRGNSLYLILSGSLRILSNSPHQNEPHNTEDTLAYLDRGDVLGEMALLAGEPYSHKVIVENTAEFLVLVKKDFDALIERDPTMAVHLSRILSGQLASQQQDDKKSAPAQIITVIPALPEADQGVFAVNLGTTLVEQTRGRVLMIMVGCGGENLARSLGLSSTSNAQGAAGGDLFSSIRSMAKEVSMHPSGLELLFINEATAFGPMAEHQHKIFKIFKAYYDYCIFVLPPVFNDVLMNILNESNRSLVITAPYTPNTYLSIIRKCEQAMRPTRKLEKVWLDTDAQSAPLGFISDFRLPWDSEWGREYMRSGVPFLPDHAKWGQRMMDRLARSLGQLTIGFAMGSGSAYGYSLIGMLRVFEREGIFPDVISGTSMGSLIGAFYTSGISPDDLEKIALGITRKNLWKMSELTIPRSGIMTGRGILKFLRNHLGDKTFNDTHTPFACVATDIETGKEIVIKEGSLAEGVRASLSLPFFYSPHYMNGRYLVDGGLVNPVPTSIIVNQGAKILISANLTTKTSDRRVPNKKWKNQIPTLLKGPSIPEILMKTIYTMQYEIASARAEISHVVIKPNTKGQWWWDFDRADVFIRLGEAAAEESLPKIKSLLPFFSNHCQIKLKPTGRKIY